MEEFWYKHAIIYSVDVELLADSDADGIGDFRGLMNRLDYISGINATCIWLLPFYRSPRRDYGYDISDFYAVDPRFGTLGDFSEFARKARSRGIKLLVDLVVNHTSIDHPWFQEARRNRDSIYRDYYVWSDEKPPDARKGQVFKGSQQSTWTWDETAQSWYFHRFYKHEPDLNIANPRVRKEIGNIIAFWTELGVAGFRMDAVPFTIGAEHVKTSKRQDPFKYLVEFRRHLARLLADGVILAEANVAPEAVPKYVGEDKLHMLFNFYLNQHVFLALATEDAAPIVRAWDTLPQLPEECQWAMFLRNHDELDLGRLSEGERDRVMSEFAPQPDMRLYGRGIRRRLAPLLNGDRQRIELAYSLMLTLPGTPVIRYGEEIGMGDDLSLPERESIRTPMQWSDETNAGFSAAPPEKLVRKVIRDPKFGYERVNAEAEQRDRNSLLNWLEHKLRVRRSHSEFALGSLEFIATWHPSAIAYRRTAANSSVLAIHNLSSGECTVKIDIGKRTAGLESLLSCVDPVVHHDQCEITIEPFGYRWYRESKKT